MNLKVPTVLVVALLCCCNVWGQNGNEEVAAKPFVVEVPQSTLIWFLVGGGLFGVVALLLALIQRRHFRVRTMASLTFAAVSFPSIYIFFGPNIGSLQIDFGVGLLALIVTFAVVFLLYKLESMDAIAHLQVEFINVMNDHLKGLEVKEIAKQHGIAETRVTGIMLLLTLYQSRT